MGTVPSTDQTRRRGPSNPASRARTDGLGRFVTADGRPDTAAIMVVFDFHASRLYQAACDVGGSVVAADVVEAVMVDISLRPERFDLDDAPLLRLLESDTRRHALAALVAADRVRFAERYRAATVDAVAALPADQGDLIVLIASGRYTSRTLSALLRQPPSVLAARIHEGLGRLETRSTRAEGGAGRMRRAFTDRGWAGTSRCKPCR